MGLILLIVFFGLLATVFIYTLVFHFLTNRSTKAVFLLVFGIVSAPLLGLNIFVFFSQSFQADAKMWAIACIGVIGAFWLKSPLKDLRQG